MFDVDQQPADPAQLRRAYGCFPSGVTAVCAMIADQPVGMAASSFTSVSLEPPLVSVCMGNGSTTWPRLRDRARIGISVLADGQEATCRALSGTPEDRFANVEWKASIDGAVFVLGASLWLNCSVSAELPAGDHTIIVLRVHGLRADLDREPLVFHSSRFRQLAAL